MSARDAREKAGLSVEEAAKRARVCVPYLRAVERRGGASYVLAMRLARLYRCSATIFLYRTKGSETPKNAPGRRPKRSGARNPITPGDERRACPRQRKTETRRTETRLISTPPRQMGHPNDQ